MKCDFDHMDALASDDFERDIVMPSAPGVQGGILAFLVWMNAWLKLLVMGRGVAGSIVEPEAERINRYYRRISGKTISSVRLLGTFRYFCRPDISPTQFAERLCALSLLGRVRVYKMRYWGSVLQRRAVLVCYDHGHWRAPIGKMGRVGCGFWCAHLWPF